MIAESVAVEILGSEVQLVSTLEVGTLAAASFKTVGVWPEERLSVVRVGDSLVACQSQEDVAHCVANIGGHAAKDDVLSFIRQTLPSYCFILDETVPKSVTMDIRAVWNQPTCEEDRLEFFVNDGESESVYRWVLSGAEFFRECVGPGTEVMRA